MPSASDRTLLSKSCIIAGGSSACVTCPPGPQGPKGDPGAGLTFPTSYAGQVLYVGETGDISTNPNFFFESTGGTYGATLGKLTVKGLLDPNGIQITPSGTNPYSSLQGVLWVDNAYNLHIDGTTLGGTSSSGVLSVSGTTGRVTSSGGVNPVIDLANIGVTAGNYTNSSITVDTYGRVTSASSGSAPLLLTGGTMSGSVNMGTNDITGVNNIAATTLSAGALQASASGVTITQPLTTAALSAASGALVAGTTSVSVTQPLTTAALSAASGAFVAGTTSVSITQPLTTAALSAVSVAALSLEVAKAPTSVGAPFTTTALYSAQNDMNGTATNNVLLSQGSTFFLKPVANPIVQLDTAVGQTSLYTFLVPQFYGERHVATGAVTTLYYDTSDNINIGGTTLSMNPYYCSLTNGTGSTLNMQVRYTSIPFTFPLSGPTTTPRVATPQSIKITGGTTTNTATLGSGSTKTLFLNSNGWFFM